MDVEIAHQRAIALATSGFHHLGNELLHLVQGPLDFFRIRRDGISARGLCVNCLSQGSGVYPRLLSMVWSVVGNLVFMVWSVVGNLLSMKLSVVGISLGFVEFFL